MEYNRGIAGILWTSHSGTPLDIPGTLPWDTPARPSPSPAQMAPGSRLETLNGAFKVGPRASPRRIQVQNQGDRGLGGAVGPLQSAI